MAYEQVSNSTAPKLANTPAPLTKAVMGYVLVVFLASFAMRLTVHRAPNALVKSGKLLKNHLRNLTVAVVYPDRV